MTVFRYPLIHPAHRIVALLMIALALLGGLRAARPVTAAFPGGNGVIAFEALDFATEEEQAFGIYTIDADGNNLVNLTTLADEEQQPAWSSDGARLAFMLRDNDISEIVVMDADGNNLLQITNGDGNVFYSQPVWSPDGTKLAVRREENDSEIYVIDADGSNEINLTNDPDEDRNPSWSPDGSRIAFESYRLGNEGEIFVMNADGSNLINISNHSARDEQPDWSPDGSQIVFVSHRDGLPNIYVMDADGNNQTRLTNDPEEATEPVWSPDGTKIAFVSWRTGNPALFVMNADGSNQVQVSPGHFEILGNPSWQPLVTSQPSELVATADSFLCSGHDNTNEGANPTMVLRASGNNRALVTFDTSALSQPVSAAALRLYIVHNGNNWGNEGQTIDAHQVTGAWVEGNGANHQPANLTSAQFNPLQNRGSGPGVTWSCAVDANVTNQSSDCSPKWNGGAYDPLPSDTVTIYKDFNGNNSLPPTAMTLGWIEFEVTADLNECIANGDDRCSWIIKKTREGQSGHIEFASSEGAAVFYDVQYGEAVAPHLALTN